jgi:hypothetical protein
MIPVDFPEANAVLAMDQDEYEPIKIHLEQLPEGRATCCFRLSDAEVAELVSTRTIWIQQLTFQRGFAPIALSSQKPPMGGVTAKEGM